MFGKPCQAHMKGLIPHIFLNSELKRKLKRIKRIQQLEYKITGQGESLVD